MFEWGFEFPSLRKEERLLVEGWAYAGYKIHSSFLVSSLVSVLQATAITYRSFLKVFEILGDFWENAWEPNGIPFIDL